MTSRAAESDASRPARASRRTGATRHVCFELDGARVHGDPAMDDASRAALREIIDAGRRLLAESVPAAPVPPTAPRASTDLPDEPPP